MDEPYTQEQRARDLFDELFNGDGPVSPEILRVSRLNSLIDALEKIRRGYK